VVILNLDVQSWRAPTHASPDTPVPIPRFAKIVLTSRPVSIIEIISEGGINVMAESSVSQVDQSTDRLKETQIVIVNILKELHQLNPGDLLHALDDLETLVDLATMLRNQVQELSSTHGHDGTLRSGCIVVKYVNDCGPYGYLVTSSGGRRDWKYLGKAEDGTLVKIYPPEAPLRFFKRKRGWIHVGNWDNRLTYTPTSELLVNDKGDE
jgi:hypothetical protein